MEIDKIKNVAVANGMMLLGALHMPSHSWDSPKADTIHNCFHKAGNTNMIYNIYEEVEIVFHLKKFCFKPSRNGWAFTMD